MLDAADDSRNQWASLLTGMGGLNPLATWLGLAAQASESDAFAPWLEAWTTAVQHAGSGAFGWFAPAAESPLARLLGHPAAVVGGENSLERLSLGAGLALADFLRSALSHHALQSGGWMHALRVFFAEFARTDAEPVALDSLGDVAAHWGKVGEAALQEHARSEAFLQSQAQLLRKAMGYRIAQRRLSESLARANDLPTLSDLDEAFGAIHTLRREVRDLRRVAERNNARVPRLRGDDAGRVVQ